MVMERRMYSKLFLAVCCAVFISGCASTGPDIYPHYNGLYYNEMKTFTMYFRFFEGGRVINANTDGLYDYSITEWFNQNFSENQGTYSIGKGKIYFSLKSPEGIVEYSGVLNRKHIKIYDDEGNIKSERDEDLMKLKMRSFINGNKKKLEFEFMEGI